MNAQTPITNQRAYDLGYQDGRAGLSMFPGGTHPDYRSGWCDGEVALEEYENGYGPVWMS